MNKEDLKIGMYVRYKRGSTYYGYGQEPPERIGKIIDRYNNSDIYKLDGNTDILENDIIKASFNIIDIFEVGDYVNGYEVVEEPCNDNFSVGQKHLWLCNKKLYLLEQDIKSIVTREQFEQMSYKLEK